MRMRTGSNELWRTGVGALGAAAVLLSALLVPAESWAQGCAMCATYLSNGADPRAEAFKISIMFLMAMPFLVVTTAGGWLVWMYRRSRPSPSIGELEEEGVS